MDNEGITREQAYQMYQDDLESAYKTGNQRETDNGLFAPPAREAHRLRRKKGRASHSPRAMPGPCAARMAPMQYVAGKGLARAATWGSRGGQSPDPTVDQTTR